MNHYRGSWYFKIGFLNIYDCANKTPFANSVTFYNCIANTGSLRLSINIFCIKLLNEPIHQYFPCQAFVLYVIRKLRFQLYVHSYMWPDLPKCALFAHNFNAHISPKPNRYNNKLTVHVCTTTKGIGVCFYWGLFFPPVWCSQVPVWSLNVPILPG